MTERWPAWIGTGLGLGVRWAIGIGAVLVGGFGILVAYGLAALSGTGFEPTSKTWLVMGLGAAVVGAGIGFAVRPSRLTLATLVGVAATVVAGLASI